jgi:cobalt-zinc-cadmium efflux system outer membrane protein
VRPNPELSLEIENVFGTGALSGVKDLETTLQLSQLVDLGGRRARRIAAARTEQGLTEADAIAKRVDIAAEVARRFTEAVADTERLSSARRARELGEQTVAAVRTRVEASLVSPIELNKARTALAVLRIEEEHAEHELAVCHRSLAAILGEPEPSFDHVRADLLALPAMPEFDDLASRIESSPTITRFDAETQWRDAQVMLAQSLRRSQSRVSAGLRRVESTDDFGFVAGISIPMPLRDENPGTLREARERRAQIAPALASARLEMRATLFGVYQEMLHAQTALALLREEVIPLAEETLALVNQGYRDGRFSLVDLLDAQRSLIEQREQVVANAASFHLHVITIERLLGGPFEADPNTP